MYKTEYINKKLILDAGSFAFFRFFKDGTSFSFFFIEKLHKCQDISHRILNLCLKIEA